MSRSEEFQSTFRTPQGVTEYLLQQIDPEPGDTNSATPLVRRCTMLAVMLRNFGVSTYGIQPLLQEVDLTLRKTRPTNVEVMQKVRGEVIDYDRYMAALRLCSGEDVLPVLQQLGNDVPSLIYIGRQVAPFNPDAAIEALKMIPDVISAQQLEDVVQDRDPHVILSLLRLEKSRQALRDEESQNPFGDSLRLLQQSTAALIHMQLPDDLYWTAIINTLCIAGEISKKVREVNPPARAQHESRIIQVLQQLQKHLDPDITLLEGKAEDPLYDEWGDVIRQVLEMYGDDKKPEEERIELYGKLLGATRIWDKPRIFLPLYMLERGYRTFEGRYADQGMGAIAKKMSEGELDDPYEYPVPTMNTDSLKRDATRIFQGLRQRRMLDENGLWQHISDFAALAKSLDK